jgi:hypothetical protein
MYFSGIESVSIQFSLDKEGILGPSNLQLRCKYTLGNGESIFTTSIQAYKSWVISRNYFKISYIYKLISNISLNAGCEN